MMNEFLAKTCAEIGRVDSIETDQRDNLQYLDEVTITIAITPNKHDLYN